MRPFKAFVLRLAPLLVISIWLLTGCNESSTVMHFRHSLEHPDNSPSRSLPVGTEINVALGDNLSSETAHVNDVWHGTVTENVRGENGGVIVPGSEVSGTIIGVVHAGPGSRAMLELCVTSIRIRGHDEPIMASAAPVLAGTTRARFVATSDGDVLTSSPIGNAVADGRSAVAEESRDEGVTARFAARSTGFRVALRDGAVMSFSVSQTVALR